MGLLTVQPNTTARTFRAENGHDLILWHEVGKYGDYTIKLTWLADLDRDDRMGAAFTYTGYTDLDAVYAKRQAIIADWSA